MVSHVRKAAKRQVNQTFNTEKRFEWDCAGVISSSQLFIGDVDDAISGIRDGLASVLEAKSGNFKCF